MRWYPPSWKSLDEELWDAKGYAMNFQGDWTEFALDAEVDHFGTSRIAKNHNLLRSACKESVSSIEGYIRWEGATSSERELIKAISLCVKNLRSAANLPSPW
jgi:hypothetical protein